MATRPQQLVSTVIPASVTYTQWLTYPNSDALLCGLEQTYPQHYPLIMIIGMKNYLRQQERRHHHDYTMHVLGQSTEPARSPAHRPEAIERQLLAWQMDRPCGILLVDHWRAAAKWIERLTREIAFQPYRYVTPILYILT
jgi:hypothetical protein